MNMIVAVVEAIIGLGVEGTTDKVKRNSTILALLQRFNLAGSPLDDFDSVYSYAIVEYGVGKPRPILELLKDEDIIHAYQKSFYQNDSSIFDKEAAGAIERHAKKEQFKNLDIDAGTIIAGFTIIFEITARRSRSVPEVLQDRELGNLTKSVTKQEEMLNSLHQDLLVVTETIDQLKTQSELKSMRSEIFSEAGTPLMFSEQDMNSNDNPCSREQLKAMLNMLSDVEFRDVIYSCFSVEERNMLSKPTQVISRSDLLGDAEAMTKCHKIRSYLYRKYEERFQNYEG